MGWEEKGGEPSCISRSFREGELRKGGKTAWGGALDLLAEWEVKGKRALRQRKRKSTSIAGSLRSFESMFLVGRRGGVACQGGSMSKRRT